MSESAGARLPDGAVAPARWMPSPLLIGSAALHAALGAGLLVRPDAWPYALGTFTANHGLLTAAGLLPRCAWLGANWRRLPPAAAAAGAVALTIDDGPDPEVTPLVLDLLAAGGAQATFFCIGERVRAHAPLARRIVAAGHAIENHTEHHRHNFSFLGRQGFAREISAAQRSIEDATGVAPRFFRAPAGLRNPWLDPVLHRLGLQLVSWTRRGYDTRSRDAARIAQRLLRGLAGGDILLLHDGHAARANGTPMIETVLPRVMVGIAGAGLATVRLRDCLPPSSATAG